MGGISVKKKEEMSLKKSACSSVKISCFCCCLHRLLRRFAPRPPSQAPPIAPIPQLGELATEGVARSDGGVCEDNSKTQ